METIQNCNAFVFLNYFTRERQVPDGYIHRCNVNEWSKLIKHNENSSDFSGNKDDGSRRKEREKEKEVEQYSSLGGSYEKYIYSDVRIFIYNTVN